MYWELKKSGRQKFHEEIKEFTAPVADFYIWTGKVRSTPKNKTIPIRKNNGYLESFLLGKLTHISVVQVSIKGNSNFLFNDLCKNLQAMLYHKECKSFKHQNFCNIQKVDSITYKTISYMK